LPLTALVNALMAPALCRYAILVPRLRDRFTVYGQAQAQIWGCAVGRFWRG